jgi:tRNA (adenine57-N1/adenine58-N1)-methyltransferase
MDKPFDYGDSVLLFNGRNSYVVKLEGEMAAIKGLRGRISVKGIMGKSPGDTINIGSRSFHLIRPDLQDRLSHMSRGPQIILPKDAFRIACRLSLSNGKTVIEGGAGSGGLTMVLLNSVYPDGRVVTYDLREDHLKRAGSNVSTTGMDSIWEGKIGDIREGIDENMVDAVVLDIPDAEKAVGAAADALLPGGRFSSFVPTANQLERVVSELGSKDFRDISAEELLVREYSLKRGAIRPKTEMIGHTGYMIFARWLG